MKHPKQDDLLEFAAGRVEELSAERLYTHLGICDSCTDRMDVIRRIRMDFEGSWDEFLQEFKARQFFVAPLADPALARQGAFDLVIRGVLDGARRIATAAAEGLAGALGTGKLEAAYAPSYSGVGDPERAKDASRMAEEASKLLSQGNVEAAIDKLIEASKTAPDAGGAATLNLLSGGTLVGKLVIHAGRRAVSVLVNPDLVGSTQVTAVLMGEGGLEKRVPLLRVEGASYLLAEFEELPDGTFSIGIELSR
jgi:hypothetical protein